MSLRSLAALAALAISSVSAQSGNGVTTRYWDCCKPSCAWSGKAAVSAPVRTCDAQGNTLTNPDIKSGCDGGSAFTCVNNMPFVINDQLSYGFAAVSISGSSESAWCCECYELTFTSGPVNGKKMIVQATNTGGDLGSNHFDILMPGGGVGIFNGCVNQFGSWNGGAQYGGVSRREECNNLPAQVREGCYWRFDWFQNSDNPTVAWKKTSCPAELTNITGCRRNDSPPPPSPVTSSTRSTTSTTSTRSTSSTYSTPTTTTTRTTISTPSTTTRASSSSSTTSTSTPSNGGGTVPKWGQCGGLYYNGPTTCVAGTTCVKQNDWYSQCL